MDDDIASLSNPALSRDLFDIAGRMGTRRPPENLRYLRIYGVRTIVLPEGSPECNVLYEPWAKSGIMLAPVVIGYTKGFFPHYNKRG